MQSDYQKLLLMIYNGIVKSVPTLLSLCIASSVNRWGFNNIKKL